MSESITFASTRVFPGKGGPFKGHVKVTGKKIVSVGTGLPEDPGRVIDVGDLKVIPGLIDLHIHGSAGKNAMASSEEDLAVMARFLAENGVTAFQPTSSAAPIPALETGILVAREFTRGPVRGARSIGLHMEGPFLNPERKGAMTKELFLKPDVELLKRWLSMSEGTINHVTLAPELPGALEVVRHLAFSGVTVAAGHTDATYEEMLAGFEAGITVANHTYNAMRGIHQREPGALGAALTYPGVFCELIADGIHVHPGAMRLLIQSKGPDYICLITDAILATGLPTGQYTFMDRTVTVDESGKCHLPDGTLSGSTALLRNCLRNVVDWLGIPFEVALGMATVNPAKAARVWDRKGSLTPGKDADVVVMDDSYNVLWSMVEGEFQKEP